MSLGLPDFPADSLPAAVKLMVCEVKVVQSDQKVSVHLMIIIQKVTSNVQNVPRQSPDFY
jgi:hypothetical protein